MFSQGYSLYFFLICAHLWWFGVGSWIGFFGGWEFHQLMGFGACGVGPSLFFGVGAPLINIQE